MLYCVACRIYSINFLFLISTYSELPSNIKIVWMWAYYNMLVVNPLNLLKNGKTLSKLKVYILLKTSTTAVFSILDIWNIFWKNSTTVHWMDDKHYWSAPLISPFNLYSFCWPWASNVKHLKTPLTTHLKLNLNFLFHLQHSTTPLQTTKRRWRGSIWNPLRRGSTPRSTD